MMPAHVVEDWLFFEVFDLVEPGPSPFVVMKVDTRKLTVLGAEATVMSLHDDRDEAESETCRLAGRLS